MRFPTTPAAAWRALQRLACGGALLASVPFAFAASGFTPLVVNSTADTDGTVCGSTCTLRQAIQAANADPAANTIVFAVDGTIQLQGAPLPAISGGNLNLDGTGRSVTIDARQVGVAFVVNIGSDFLLNGLSVISGVMNQVNVPTGGVWSTGANVAVMNCRFSGTPGVINNAPAIHHYGGGLLTVDNCVFDALDGGTAAPGAIDTRGPANISRCTFRNNRGGQIGGAITYWQAIGPVEVRGSTFIGNQANYPVYGRGGAIWIGSAMTVINSTFHGNSASEATGGAIHIDPSAHLTLLNSTVSHNTSTQGSAVHVADRGTLTVRDTILANTVASSAPGAGATANCGRSTSQFNRGVINDRGGNLSDDASCGFTSSTSVNNTLAQLGPLQNNGGPTLTMMPMTGSPAIDQGSSAYATDPSGLGIDYDQRGAGFPRVAGTAVDRGAVEVAFTDTTAPVITPVVSGPMGLAGWYTGDVTVAWTVSDAESNVTSQTGCGAITLTADTAGRTLTCSASSLGGSASRSVTVKIDRTPPGCTLVANPSVLQPANRKMVPVGVAITTRESGSGVAQTRLVSVTSSEPDSGLARSDDPGDIAGWTVSGGQLRAESYAVGGRVYTVTHEVQDNAGLRGSCTAAVSVPSKK